MTNSGVRDYIISRTPDIESLPCCVCAGQILVLLRSVLSAYIHGWITHVRSSFRNRTSSQLITSALSIQQSDYYTSQSVLRGTTSVRHINHAIDGDGVIE